MDIIEQLRQRAVSRQAQDALCYADGGIETNMKAQDYIEWKAADEIERLRTALEPFAEIAKEIQPVCLDNRTISLAWADPKVGDFRRALAALTPDKGA